MMNRPGDEESESAAVKQITRIHRNRNLFNSTLTCEELKDSGDYKLLSLGEGEELSDEDEE